MPDQFQKATKLKLRYEKEWLGISGVSAIGVGRVNENIGIIISVVRDADTVRAQVPSSVEGIPIKIQVTGTLSV
jgi:hypothetical protein